MTESNQNNTPAPAEITKPVKISPAKQFSDKLRVTLDTNEVIKGLFINNSYLKHETFVSKVIATVATNEALQKCSLGALVDCCSKSAQLGLPVDANGYAYIIPRKKSQKDESGKWSSITEPTFQIGYKGYVELAKRNKKVKSIDTFCVYEGEVDDQKHFDEIKSGRDKNIFYRPNYKIDREDESIALVVAVIEYATGGFEWEVMTKSEVNKAKAVNVKKDKEGKDYFSPWTDWWGEMAKKTVLRRLLKRSCLMNIDQAIELDQDPQYNNEKEIEPVNLAPKLAAQSIPSLDDIPEHDEANVIEPETIEELIK